jgi:hypothetical protein
MLQQPGGALDVGEEEGDRALGQRSSLVHDSASRILAVPFLRWFVSWRTCPCDAWLIHRHLIRCILTGACDRREEHALPAANFA